MSLRRNFSWAFFGNAFYSAAQFAVLVLLAKQGSAELVGRYSLGLAVCTPIVLFANLKLAEVQATDAGGEFSWGDYFGLRMVSTPLALLGIVGVTVASGYTGEARAVVLTVGLAKGIEALSDLAWGTFLRHERNDLIARSQFLRGIASLVAFSIGVGLLSSLVAGVGLLAAFWALVALVDLRTAAALQDSPGVGRPRFDLSTLGTLSWLTLPLGVTVTIGSLQVNLPRYLVEQSLGEVALGIFAGISYLLIAGSLVLRSISMAATPRLAKLWFDGDRPGFVRLLAQIVAIAITLGATAVGFAWLLGEPLLWLLFDPVFAQRTDVLVLLMFAAALTWASLFFGAAVNAMRQFRVQVPIHATSLVAVLVGCFLWLDSHGLVGAAWALILGSATTLTLYVPTVAWYLRNVPRKPVEP